MAHSATLEPPRKTRSTNASEAEPTVDDANIVSDPLTPELEGVDEPLVDGGETDPERSALLQEAADLREQVKTLELRLSRVNELDLAIIDAEIQVATLQSEVQEQAAELKRLKEDLKQAMAHLRSCVSRRRSGQKELFTPDQLNGNAVPESAASIEIVDEHAAGPITLLLAKEMKKIVGPEEFKAAKERGEPIGMTEKQMEVLEAADITTIGGLEKTMRENAWWHKNLKGFGPDKIDRLTITLAAFRRKFPMPSVAETLEAAADRDLLPSADAEPAEWQRAIASIKSLLQSCQTVIDEAPEEGVAFAEDVTRQVTEMLVWIREREHVTDDQVTAIANWSEGVAKWHVSQ